ncbi:MAG TPA: alpha/beta hydrolase, partial [Nitrospira sp.]|nr:alpha/beta hydrolase [Nitrospira sp.]
MTTLGTKSGFVPVDNARLYYETAGQGVPLVMIHAGVADSRQWNNEFAFFAPNYRVVRYDMRGYGKSEPVDGEFNPLDDLVTILNTLGIHEPVVIMGCSMGG